MPPHSSRSRSSVSRPGRGGARSHSRHRGRGVGPTIDLVKASDERPCRERRAPRRQDATERARVAGRPDHCADALRRVRGRRRRRDYPDRNICYARAQRSRRRFRSTRPVRGIRDGNTSDLACPQPPPRATCSSGARCAESTSTRTACALDHRSSDSTGDPLPVMVWVHGGSYVSGAGDLGGDDRGRSWSSRASWSSW